MCPLSRAADPPVRVEEHLYSKIRAKLGFERCKWYMIGAAIVRANSHLSRVEQIKRFTILRNDWAPAGDELTATMKLKRRSIMSKYASEIEALYE